MMGNADIPGFPLRKESLMPQEEMLEIGRKKKTLRIAVAKEWAKDESRVALAPHAVELLVCNGHDVIIEKEAGKESNFNDMMYSEVGGLIVEDREEIYKCDIIVKVAPLNEKEISLLKGNQVIISSFQIATQSAEYIQKLTKKRVTALGFEYLMDRKEAVFPIEQSMMEISGTTSILIAAEYLSNANNGKGEMLGGISGISPTDIVILGAGTAGEFAARTALGLGATVKVFDGSVYRLRALQERLGARIFTSILQPRILAKALKTADVAIGAIAFEKDIQTFLVSEEAVKQMKPYSVIVDLRIDHGGCFETSRITSFKNPVYHEHNVVHYCVPNIPSRVARTASYALSNILGQIILELGDAGGMNSLIKNHRGVRSGIYIYNGVLTKESIGNRFGLPYQDINLLTVAF
ncbi:MAG: alanine dehydrogenase [Salinivirgaceae bacterium]|jgi:alanine dehydrogenase|nr:alanine dehydrogenase [Salinivirgaceae bacterium]